MFQLNVNCIMTNKKLYKMNIINNDKCSFCNDLSEDMKHQLLWECKCVKDIWNIFNNWSQTYLKLNIDLNFKLIIVCYGPDLLYSLCLILMKRIIYRSNHHPLNILNTLLNSLQSGEEDHDEEFTML